MGWSVFKSDNFNRADDPTGIGSKYPSGGSDWKILSNQAVLIDPATDRQAMWSDIGDFYIDYPNQSSSALIYMTAASSMGNGGGVHVRQNILGTKELYRLVVCSTSGVPGPGAAELSRFIGGSYTLLAQYTGFTFTSGQRLTLRVIGSGTATTLESIYNGVSLGTYNDNGGSALNNGQPGICYSSNAIGTLAWDDAEYGIYTADAATYIDFGLVGRGSF